MVTVVDILLEHLDKTDDQFLIDWLFKHKADGLYNANVNGGPCGCTLTAFRDCRSSPSIAKCVWHCVPGYLGALRMIYPTREAAIK